MNYMVKTATYCTLFILLVFIFSCKKSNNQNVQSNCTVSKAVSLPVNVAILNGSGQFAPLTIFPSSIYVSTGGISGIIVYRMSANQFFAFERSCTKDGCDNAKAKVWVQAGNSAMKDSICGSSFSIQDGTVQNGPATVALFQYHTSWDGNILHIYN